MTGFLRRYGIAVLLLATGLALGIDIARAQDAAAVQLGQLEARYKAGQRTSELGNAYHSLAIQLRNVGNNARAEQPARRALAIWEAAHGANSGAVANACNTLAAILDQLRQDAEAEHCARRALRIWEKEYGLDSGEAANVLNTLVGIMRTRGRWLDAEESARRILRIWTKTAGPDSDAVANASNTLSDVLQRLQKFDEAEKLARNALRIWPKLHGPDSEAANNARNTLAGALDGLGRKDEALRERQRVLDSWSRVFGPRSGVVGLGANNLAWRMLGAGQIDQAEALFKQALSIWSETDHRLAKPSTGIPLSGLSHVAIVKRDWENAYSWTKQAAEIALQRSRIYPVDANDPNKLFGPQPEFQKAGDIFDRIVKTANQLILAGESTKSALFDEMLSAAQWRTWSSTAAALAAMAERAAYTPDLAPLANERRNLIARLQDIDRNLDYAGDAERELIREVKSVESRLAGIDRQLSSQFPNYAAVAHIDQLSVDAVQALLKPEEALILLLPTAGVSPLAEETFIWAVTKGEIRWVRSDLGTSALHREVAALRCGLDYSGSWGRDVPTCPVLTRTNYTDADHRAGIALPFDLARAHGLYKSVLGQVEDLIKDKHILIVPSGALTQLPFQVLVEAPPDPRLSGFEALRAAKWLIRSHAITVLPSVSSLQALRLVAKSSRAIKPMVGFGNPLLDGAPSDRDRARLARANDTCPVKFASIQGLGRSVGQVVTRGRPSDIAARVRGAPPLPETADELCTVAKYLGAAEIDIHLGARATVSDIERLSHSGELLSFRLVHFATTARYLERLTVAPNPD